MIKEIIYIVPYETKEEQKRAQDFRDKLRETHDHVDIYPTPFDARIIVEDQFEHETP